MATLTSKLTLTGSAAHFGAALSLSTSNDFTFTHTNGIARKKITSTAVGTASGQVTIDTADEYGSPSVIYIKNTAAYASDGTGTIYCYFVGPDGTDRHEIQIPGGMFAYIPSSSDATLKAYTATSGTIIEFMVLGTQA
tara:strand:- start:5373 stop:5786 length:414 start_codon:yes stop_codon:yes gene_type:complete